MTIGTTFGKVIEMVRSEVGISSNTSRGIDYLDNIKEKIRRVHESEAEEFDWQHLDLKRTSAVSRKVLAAGQRVYDFPAGINPEKIEGAWVRWGSVWHPLEYGITYHDRTAFNPDENQRSDPILGWRFSGIDQFEIWPLPNSNGVANGSNEVAFEGQRKVNALVDTDDVLDLDDRMVSMLVAAEILVGMERIKSAELLNDAALNRRLRMRANLSTQTRYVMGKGAVSDHADRPRHPQYIPYTR